MLSVINLEKRFKRFKAVDNVSFTIEEGQIFGFVGANGAGKTTTMKIIAGLLAPNHGNVLLDGIDISAKPRAVKKKIGYMPDFFGVYDDLKVMEYMNFYAGVYGIDRSKREAANQQLVELVNLADKKDAYVDSLSRGMKQRLCLARSLIHNPKLLILDEPASGLDPRARIEMKEILKELKNMGKTILISSHILPELAEMCTSIGIIDKGKMILSGKVEEIMRRVSGTRVIRIKVLGEKEPLVRFLLERPNIENVVTTSDAIEIDFSGDDAMLSQLLKAILASDISVLSFSELEKNLESVFMHVINGGSEKNGGN